MQKATNELNKLSKGFLQIVQTEYKEKILLGLGDDHHFTLHFGTFSGFLDIHKTFDDGTHETLFKIRHFTLARICVSLQKTTIYAYRKYWFSKRINIGKLKKYNCYLFPISYNEEEVKDYFEVKRNGKYIRVRKNISFEKHMGRIISPDDIQQHASGQFMVYRFKNNQLYFQGMLIKSNDAKSKRSFIFCSTKNYNAFTKLINHKIFMSLRKVEFEGKDSVIKILWQDGLKKYYTNQPKVKQHIDNPNELFTIRKIKCI